MLHSFHLADNTLLEDLLEASERLYHRNVTTIQSVFSEEYLGTLRKHQAQNPCLEVEDFIPYRRQLKDAQARMVEEQRALRRQRDESIWTFVQSASPRTAVRGPIPTDA